MTTHRGIDIFTKSWQDPISRRSLLRAAGIGTTSIMLGGALANCSSGGPEAEDAHADGDFSAGLTGAFPNLDVSVIPYVGSIVASWFWAERLYRVDPYPPRDNLIPELALDLPQKISSQVYRIALREGVVFHDGRPLTAEDVVFTLTWIKDPATGSLWAQFFEIIETIEAVSAHEVELTLATPTTLLAARLALVPIRPAGTSTPFELEPIGTGPYRVTAAVSDEKVELERFADYAGDREFNYERITIDVVTDANARISGLRTGQFDVIEDLPESAYEQLEAANGIEVASVDSYSWSTLYFNCGVPPFDDVRVRQAVMYALDRDSIATTSYFGHAVPAWAGFVSPDHPEFVEPSTVYRYDPERAMELIRQSPYGGSTIPIDFLILSDTESIFSQGPIVEENLRAVGFEPNMTPVESSASSTQMSEGRFHAYLGGAADLSPFSPALEFLLRFSFTGFVTESLAHWTGDEANQVVVLLNQAVAAPDDAARAAILAEVQNIVQDQVPIGAVFHTKQLTAWSDQLEGYRALPIYGIVLDGVQG